MATELIKLWSGKQKLNDDHIKKALDTIPSLKTLDLERHRTVYVGPVILHQRRSHDTYIQNLKKNLELLGCFNDDVDFVAFVLWDKGCHFSGAILDKKDNKICYYDSLDNMNFSEFTQLVKSLNAVGLCKEGSTKALMMDFYQQPEGWECGYYVL